MQVTLMHKNQATEMLTKNKRVIMDRLYNNKHKNPVRPTNPEENHHHSKLRITTRMQQEKENREAVSTKPSICQSQQESMLLSCYQNDSALAHEQSKGVTPFTLSPSGKHSAALQAICVRTAFDDFWDQHTVKYKRIDTCSAASIQNKISRNLLKELYAAQACAQNRHKQNGYQLIKTEVPGLDQYHHQHNLARTAYFAMPNIDANSAYQQQSSINMVNQQQQLGRMSSQHVNRQVEKGPYSKWIINNNSQDSNIGSVRRSKTEISLNKERNIAQIADKPHKQPKLELNINRPKERSEFQGRLYHQGNNYRYLRPIPRAHTERCRVIEIESSVRQSGSIRRQNSTSNLLQMQESSSQKLKQIREQLHQIYRGLGPNPHPSGYSLQLKNQTKPMVSKNSYRPSNDMAMASKNQTQNRIAQGMYHICARKGLEVQRTGTQHHHYSHRLLLSRPKLHA